MTSQCLHCRSVSSRSEINLIHSLHITLELVSRFSLCDYLVEAYADSRKDNALPWYMQKLMVTYVSYLELTFSVIFHSTIELLRKVLSVLLTLYSHLQAFTDPCLQHWVVDFPIVNPGCSQISLFKSWVLGDYFTNEQPGVWSLWGCSQCASKLCLCTGPYDSGAWWL